MNDKQPMITAVDITDYMIAYSALPSMQIYYEYYPLREMVLDLFTVKGLPGTDERFYEKLADRLPAIVPIDDLLLQNFIETLSYFLDSIIMSTLGDVYSEHEYRVIKWLEGNSILLEIYEP